MYSLIDVPMIVIFFSKEFEHFVGHCKPQFTLEQSILIAIKGFNGLEKVNLFRMNRYEKILIGLLFLLKHQINR